MRAQLLTTVASALFLISTSTSAQPAAQYSVDDVVETFSAKDSAVTDNCGAQNMITAPDGTCLPGKVTRGFSLGGAGKAAERPAPKPVRAAPIGSRTATARPATGGLVTQAPVRQVGKGDLLINFKLGSAELTDQARANAGVFAQGIQRDELKSVRFEIAGHTDSSGGQAVNQALSQERADSVRAFLVSQGVDGSRLISKGYGYSQLAVPKAPGSPENRRVEARRLN